MTRSYFLWANGLAIFLVPFVVVVGRVAGGVVGWMFILFLLAGAFVTAVFYVVLLLFSALIPEEQRESRWLGPSWWSGAITATVGMSILPDFGDAPDSAVAHRLFDALPKEQAIDLSQKLGIGFISLGLCCYLVWVVIVLSTALDARKRGELVV
ncbi:hypothetical protein WG915_11465 [Corynebacterium sp. H128]|uniref:hypothetical protein n=1 Tax=unclassified Corynebacterium TaxID=2624378 RepID=UPI003097B525